MLELNKQLEHQQLDVLNQHLNKEVEQKLNEIFEKRGWITNPQFIFDHSMWVEWQAPDPALNEVYKAKYYCKSELFLEVTRYQSLTQRDGAVSIIVTQQLNTQQLNTQQLNTQQLNTQQLNTQQLNTPTPRGEELQ